MKNVLSLVVIGSALALTACGGSSESSSFEGTKTLVNGNKYTCPSKAALDSCKDDNTCAMSCELTDKKVTPVEPNDPNKDNACETEGKNVYGKKGSSCLVSLDFLNSGKETTFDCLTNGTAVLSNGMQASSGEITLNGYMLACR